MFQGAFTLVLLLSVTTTYVLHALSLPFSRFRRSDCCERLKSSGKCGHPAVCCYTQKDPFCSCNAPDDEAEALDKYRPIKNRPPGSVIISHERYMSVQTKLARDSKKLCYNAPGGQQGKGWSRSGQRDGSGEGWVNMSECCCEMFEATFVGKCCHTDSFEYCYDCPHDAGQKRAIRNRQPCWMQFSTEMNIVNNKNQLTSLSSLYCAIHKCRVCSPIDTWPFSKCWGTKSGAGGRGPHRGRGPLIAAITTRRTRGIRSTNTQCLKTTCKGVNEDINVPYYVDMTAVCCKMMNCTGDCRRIDTNPYCQCITTDTKGRTPQCNVNRETCFAKMAPPMMVLGKDSSTNQCDEAPILAYEICCAMRKCERNGGDKKRCCVSSGQVAKSCYCCR